MKKITSTLPYSGYISIFKEMSECDPLTPSALRDRENKEIVLPDDYPAPAETWYWPKGD